MPRRRIAIALARSLALGVLIGSFLACQSSPPPARRPEPQRSVRSVDFSADRAWAHLTTLAGFGARPLGSEASAQAREYIKSQLRELGLEIREQIVEHQSSSLVVENIEVRNISGIIPGESEDVIILAAPYDTREAATGEVLGADGGGSGVALLLEMARALVERPLAYQVWITFLDGEAYSLDAEGRPLAASGLMGSAALAGALVRQGALRSLRLMVVFDRVAGKELRIARDLRSTRHYREEFWKAATNLGHTEVFSPAGKFESPIAGHRPFLAYGARQVVAITGSVRQPQESDDPGGDTIENCSPEKLETVGVVSLEALGNLSRRLVKIDRFAESPLGETPAASTPSAEKEEPATDASTAAETPAAAKEPEPEAAQAAPEAVEQARPAEQARPEAAEQAAPDAAEQVKPDAADQAAPDAADEATPPAEERAPAEPEAPVPEEPAASAAEPSAAEGAPTPTIP